MKYFLVQVVQVIQVIWVIQEISNTANSSDAGKTSASLTRLSSYFLHLFKSFMTFLPLAYSKCWYRHDFPVHLLGTVDGTNADEFSEKFQTAPPPLFKLFRKFISFGTATGPFASSSASCSVFWMNIPLSWSDGQYVGSTGLNIRGPSEPTHVIFGRRNTRTFPHNLTHRRYHTYRLKIEQKCKWLMQMIQITQPGWHLLDFYKWFGSS